MQIGRIILAFILAVLVTSLLGAIFHTQFVLAGLTALGVDIPLAERLSTTLHDIRGLGPSYGAVMGLGFLVAMSAGALVFRLAGVQRTLVYTVAGGVAAAVALVLMKQAYDITPIAGARGIAGFSAQVLAGLLGGFTFAKISDRP